MTKLKLGAIEDDKPVKLTVEIPAVVHRSLVAYAEAIGREGRQVAPEPAKLVAPMLEKFMAADRAFRRLRRHPSDRTPTATDRSSTSGGNTAPRHADRKLEFKE
jgi:hypothetical protein